VNIVHVVDHIELESGLALLILEPVDLLPRLIDHSVYDILSVIYSFHEASDLLFFIFDFFL